jgi:hypothetical protein
MAAGDGRDAALLAPETFGYVAGAESKSQQRKDYSIRW